jgi:hypothetical protein
MLDYASILNTSGIATVSCVTGVKDDTPCLGLMKAHVATTTVQSCTMQRGRKGMGKLGLARVRITEPVGPPATPRVHCIVE